MPDLTRRRALEWGTATSSYVDRQVGGDLAVVVPTTHGALLAAIDGFGRSEEAAHAGTPREIADRIVSSHWNRTDDAVVVVLRYLGTRT